jgi:hypothetical protein
MDTVLLGKALYVVDTERETHYAEYRVCRDVIDSLLRQAEDLVYERKEIEDLHASTCKGISDLHRQMYRMLKDDVNVGQQRADYGKVDSEFNTLLWTRAEMELNGDNEWDQLHADAKRLHYKMRALSVRILGVQSRLKFARQELFLQWELASRLLAMRNKVAGHG